MNLGKENEKQEFKLGLGQLDKGVTCSHHFRFAKKWGLPVQGRYRSVSAGYPRASPGSIAYR